MFACLRVSPCLVSFVAGNRPNITTRRNNKNIINSRNEFTSCLFLLPLCMNKYRNEYLTRFLINYLLDSKCSFFVRITSHEFCYLFEFYCCDAFYYFIYLFTLLLYLWYTFQHIYILRRSATALYFIKNVRILIHVLVNWIQTPKQHRL